MSVLNRARTTDVGNADRPRSEPVGSRRGGPEERFRRLLTHLGLVMGSIVMLYPLVWMLASSFKPTAQIFISAGLWPGEAFTWDNYVTGWEAFGYVTFADFFRNSLIIAVLCILGNLLSCSMAAYAFARLRFPGRRILFAMMLGTLMLPFHALLIPQYVLFSEFGWVNTFLPLIVPKFLAVDAFFVFLMVQFIRTLPRELSDSAKIDGCGHFQIFFRIILPLSLPALGTTSVFTFIFTWNDFLTPLIYLTSPENYTVPLGLRLFLDNTGESAYGALFAMSVLSLGPIIGFFLVFQRTLVQGIATTGIK